MKIIAVDIGGTAVKSGLVDGESLRGLRETPTPTEKGGRAVMALVQEVIASYGPESADGIGGAAVLGGKLYSGAHFGAGEFGHMVTHAGGLPCPCGQKGCFERYASTSALVRRAQELDPALDSGRAIFSRLEEPAVKALVDGWIQEIVYGLASLVHLWDPSRVILCGGVMQQPYLIERLGALVPENVMPAYRSVEIRAAKLGNRAGLLGAGELARRLVLGQPG